MIQEYWQFRTNFFREMIFKLFRLLHFILSVPHWWTIGIDLLWVSWPWAQVRIDWWLHIYCSFFIDWWKFHAFFGLPGLLLSSSVLGSTNLYKYSTQYSKEMYICMYLICIQFILASMLILLHKNEESIIPTKERN